MVITAATHQESFVSFALKILGGKDQSISIQNVIMNNQAGIVEIGEVKWDN